MESVSIFYFLKRKSKNKSILLEIFNKNKNTWITKNKLENDFVSTHQEKYNTIPGDVQRDIRNIYTELKLYGLEQRGKK